MLIRRFPALNGFLRLTSILAPLGLRSMADPLLARKIYGETGHSPISLSVFHRCLALQPRPRPLRAASTAGRGRRANFFSVARPKEQFGSLGAWQPIPQPAARTCAIPGHNGLSRD